MSDPHMPPEQVNWKAVPLVALVFALFAAGIMGLAHVVRTQTNLLGTPVDPIAERVQTGGAVFTARAAHLPPVYRAGPYVLTETGQAPIVFDNAAGCVEAARFMVSERGARDPAIVCHPLQG